MSAVIKLKGRREEEMKTMTGRERNFMKVRADKEEGEITSGERAR